MIVCVLIDFYWKSKMRSAIIRNNGKFLLESIQPDDKLLASLLSHNCITKEQSQRIEKERSKGRKNSELLHVVELFDKTKFSNFVKCLRRNNQETLTRILENGGGLNNTLCVKAYKLT